MVISVTSAILVARILEPTDYGIVAIATIVFAMVMTFGDLGLTSAAIQREHLDSSEVSTLYGVRLSTSLAYFVGLNLLAPVWEGLFSAPGTALAVRVLSLTFLFSHLGYIPSVFLSRGLRFERLSLSNLMNSVSFAGVSLGLAMMGLGFLSLAIATVVGGAVSVMILWASHPWKPILSGVSLRPLRPMVSFGGKLMILTGLTFVFFNADSLVVGRVLGPVTLGYYALAYRWASQIPTYSSDVISFVLFPTLSRLGKRRTKLVETYKQGVQYAAYLSMPASLGLILIAPDFLTYALGEGTPKWADATFPLQALCIFAFLRTITEPSASIFLSTNSHDKLVKPSLVSSCMLVLGLVPASILFGINGVAVLVIFAGVVSFAWTLALTKKALSLRLSELWGLVRKPAIASLAMGLLVTLSRTALAPSLMHLAIQAMIGFTSYVVIIMALTKGRVWVEVGAALFANNR